MHRILFVGLILGHTSAFNTILPLHSMPKLSRTTVSMTQLNNVPKKKQIPEFVQELLKQETTQKNPLDTLKMMKSFTLSPGVNRTRPKQNEIYVQGLPWEYDRMALRNLFAKFYPRYCRVKTNPQNSSLSLGFGFVGFSTSKKAQAAIRGMNGIEIKLPNAHSTILKVSPAIPTSKKLQNSSTAASRALFAQEVQNRKAFLAERDSKNLVMSGNDMPRRWKVMRDKSKLLELESREDFQNEDEGEDEEDARSRAQRTLAGFLASGKRIEDVSPEQLSKELRAHAAENGGVVDPQLRRLLSMDEEEEEEDEWVDVEDEEEGLMEVAELEEEEEEERRNWEEYKRAQLQGGLAATRRSESEVAKPSGALRSGQKRRDDPRPRSPRGLL